MSFIFIALPRFYPRAAQRIIIVEDQDLIVNCTAIGPPTPNITWVWLVDNKMKSTGMGNATLNIPNIRRYQNGIYECQATNNPNEKPVTAQTVAIIYCKLK